MGDIVTQIQSRPVGLLPSSCVMFPALCPFLPFWGPILFFLSTSSFSSTPCLVILQCTMSRAGSINGYKQGWAEQNHVHPCSELFPALGTTPMVHLWSPHLHGSPVVHPMAHLWSPHPQSTWNPSLPDSPGAPYSSNSFRVPLSHGSPGVFLTTF